jgi:hypothetical protein
MGFQERAAETQGTGAVIGQGGFVGYPGKFFCVENLSEDVEEVSGGPAVAFQKGPQLHDADIELLGGPSFGRGQRAGGHSLVNLPFGGFFELRCHIGEVIEKVELGFLAHDIEVALVIAKGCQFAFLGIGIEEIGEEIPVKKGAKLTNAIEPIAESQDVGAHEGKKPLRSTGELERSSLTDEFAGDVMFDRHRKGRFKNDLRQGIVVLGEFH